MAFIDRINEEIKEAMRSRNQLRLDTLRMLKSKILTVDARGNVPDPDVVKLFKTYYGNLVEALEQSAGRPEMMEKLKGEMAIVEEFLPKALSTEETRAIVVQAIAHAGAKTKKDLGFVMKETMKLNNTVDGKLAKELATELLPD